MDEFLDQFPTVTRQQVLAVLEASKESLLTTHLDILPHLGHGEFALINS